MAKCLEASKAGVVNLDYLEDVVLQGDLDLKVCLQTITVTSVVSCVVFADSLV